MASDPASLRLVVERSEPGATATFDLDRDGLRVVLDALVEASRQDPSLYFRYSCRSGFCGTCTVLLDGRPVLACQAEVEADRSDLHLAPLGGFPVVRDLVVDPSPFAERWAHVQPRVQTEASVDTVEPSDVGPMPRTDDRRQAMIDASLDCISCGACYAACDVSASDRMFMGPAALTRAMVVLADARDTAHDARLAVVSGPAGVEGCHGIGACSLACPMALDPARAIRRVRRARTTGHL